jgi:hypothetical protein
VCVTWFSVAWATVKRVETLFGNILTNIQTVSERIEDNSNDAFGRRLCSCLDLNYLNEWMDVLIVCQPHV